MGFHMPFGGQLTMILTLMLTSQGVAAVPRASPRHPARHSKTQLSPSRPWPDRVSPSSSASTNSWTHGLHLRKPDRQLPRPSSSPMGRRVRRHTRAKVFGTPAEADLDLKSGDIAFAEAVRQD